MKTAKERADEYANDHNCSVIMGTTDIWNEHTRAYLEGFDLAVEMLRSEEAHRFPAKDGWGPKQTNSVWADYLASKRGTP